MQKLIELKECPFCGVIPKVQEYRDQNHPDTEPPDYLINCENQSCGMAGTDTHGTIFEASIQWNMRA